MLCHSGLGLWLRSGESPTEAATTTAAASPTTGHAMPSTPSPTSDQALANPESAKAPTTMAVLANVLLQLQAANAGPEHTKPILEAIAQLVAQNTQGLTQAPKPSSPPAKKPADEKEGASPQPLTASPSASTAVPAAAPPTPSTPAGTTLIQPALPSSRCNSKSHESEYKAFSRFCEKHEHAVEMRKAFEQDPKL